MLAEFDSDQTQESAYSVADGLSETLKAFPDAEPALAALAYSTAALMDSGQVRAPAHAQLGRNFFALVSRFEDESSAEPGTQCPVTPDTTVIEGLALTLERFPAADPGLVAAAYSTAELLDAIGTTAAAHAQLGKNLVLAVDRLTAVNVSTDSGLGDYAIGIADAVENAR